LPAVVGGKVSTPYPALGRSIELAKGINYTAIEKENRRTNPFFTG
jgi:hypothetical protein